MGFQEDSVGNQVRIRVNKTNGPFYVYTKGS